MTSQQNNTVITRKIKGNRCIHLLKHPCWCLQGGSKGRPAKKIPRSKSALGNQCRPQIQHMVQCFRMNYCRIIPAPRKFII